MHEAVPAVKAAEVLAQARRLSLPLPDTPTDSTKVRNPPMRHCIPSCCRRRRGADCVLHDRRRSTARARPAARAVEHDVLTRCGLRSHVSRRGRVADLPGAVTLDRVSGTTWITRTPAGGGRSLKVRFPDDIDPGVDIRVRVLQPRTRERTHPQTTPSLENV